MNARQIAAAAVLAVASGAALASHGVSEYVYARVVDVEPIVRYVTVERPREQCWQETAYEANRPLRVAGTTLAGAVVGGAVGRQFGGGRGRDALTLIGSIAGAAVANERAVRRNGYVAVPVERCEIVSERFTEERVLGYNVTYQYRGQRHTMRTSTPPGERVRLRVDVVPVGY